MSRTYNKHHRGWYGLKTEFKKRASEMRRAQVKFLIEKMMKVDDEEKEDVDFPDLRRFVIGPDWWDYY